MLLVAVQLKGNPCVKVVMLNAHIYVETGDPIPLLINEVPGSKKETKRSTALLQHLCHDRLVLSFI